jgi:hypothetical protein
MTLDQKIRVRDAQLRIVSAHFKKVLLATMIPVMMASCGTMTPVAASPRCDFCSGSGQGRDCPRHDKQARKECLK